MVQLSHPYVTTGKTIVFEYMVCHIWFEYMVCRQSDVATFQYAVYVCHSFPRSKHFLISWLQSPSAVIFEPKETKPVTASTIRRRHSKIFKAKQKLTLNWLSLVINSLWSQQDLNSLWAAVMKVRSAPLIGRYWALCLSGEGASPRVSRWESEPLLPGSSPVRLCSPGPRTQA